MPNGIPQGVQARRELLQKAIALRERGVSMNEINRAIGQDTDDAFKSIDELTRWVMQDARNRSEQFAALGEEAEQRATTLERSAERSDISEVARTAGQEASFGFSDEVIAAGRAMGPMGLLRSFLGAAGGPGGAASAAAREAARPGVAEKYEEALEEERQIVEDFGEAHPAASLIARGAGAGATMLLPVGTAGTAARGTGLLAKVGRGALAGGVGGAVGGAAVGAGTAEEGERLEGAIEGAKYGGLIGGTIGGVAPVVGAAAGAAGRRIPGIRRLFRKESAARVTQSLREHSGVRRTLSEALDDADEVLQTVRRETYQRFDDEFTEVVDEGVADALQQPELRSTVRSVSRDVAAGNRAPSFEELQEIRRRGRKAGDKSPEIGYAADALSDEMERAIPSLSDADRAYAQVQARFDAFKEGRTLAGTGKTVSTAEMRRALRQARPDGRVAMREGIVQEWVRQLEMREEGSVALLKNILDAGPEFRAQLRLGFPDQASFDGFMREVRSERIADGVARVARKWGWRATVAAAAGTGAWLGLSQ